MPAPSQSESPARSEASVGETSQAQQSARALSRSASVSIRTGSLRARSVSREDSLARFVSGSSRQSRSRSGSVEHPLGLDGKSRSLSRSVSVAGRSAGGIRAPLQRPGTRPMQGPRGKAKMRQVSSAPGGGVVKPGETSHFLLLSDQ
jgi:hypothetical protein